MPSLDGHQTFTAHELYARVRELDAAWSAATLRELLSREALSAAGRVVLVREGVYRLRRAGENVTPPMDVASAVLDALQSLAAQGRTGVTRREVEEAVAANAVPYSARSVRAGLLLLRSAEQPAVVRDAGGRYVLVRPAERG
jgi:hypothetical protein